MKERRQEALSVARQVLEVEAQALARLVRDFDVDAFDQALECLLQCRGRIVCTGIGKSGIIGRKLAGTLASTGSPAFFLHPAEAGHGDLGMIVDGDVVIVLSQSGETRELLSMLPAIRRLRVGLIALIGRPQSTLAREADVTLFTGVEDEACPLGLAPTASTTAALALGDALAMALVPERGFDAADFAAFHPRGSLGQKLVRVGDLMLSGAAVPSVQTAASLDEVLREMSSKELGMTAVLDSEGGIAGIITDGDLRRLLQGGSLSPDLHAVDFMSPNPAVVDADALATEALRLLEERKITSLLVVDRRQRLQGVLHLHRLWRTEMI